MKNQAKRLSIEIVNKVKFEDLRTQDSPKEQGLPNNFVNRDTSTIQFDPINNSEYFQG